MSSELAIIKQENIQTIVSAAPQSYNDNKLSCERCISAGQSILKTISIIDNNRIVDMAYLSNFCT